MIDQRPYRLALIALLLGVASSASAQTTGVDTLRLSPRQAIDRAIERSPALERQRAHIARARAERLIGTAFFPEFPELEASGATDAPFDAAGENEWEIGIAQRIDLGGRGSLRRAAADALVAQTEFEARALELDVRRDVGAAFARLVAAQRQVELLDTLVGFSRRLDSMAARLLAAEEISELDRNAIRIERAGAEIEASNAEGELADAQSELSALLGLARSTIVVADLDGAGTITSTALLDTIATYQQALQRGDTSALASRSDWRALDMARQRLIAQRALAGRATTPGLTLGLGIRNETSVIDGGDLTGGSEEVRRGFGEIRSSDPFLTFRVGIDLPLPFSGAYDLGTGEIAVADAELAALDAERRSIVSHVQSELTRAAGRLRAATNAIEAYRTGVAPFVRRNLELLMRGYGAGELSATEVVSQQQSLSRTTNQLIDAERNYAEAIVDIERILAR